MRLPAILLSALSLLAAAQLAPADEQPPRLVLAHPASGMATVTGGSYAIWGTASDDSGRVVSLELSDWPQWRQLTPQKPGPLRFRFRVSLHYGLNEFRIIAQDASGNRAEEHVLLYRPEPQDADG